MTWQCCTMCTRPQAAAGLDGSMRGGAASSTGFMMLLDPDMPAGLLDEATAALLDPGHVPGNEGSPLGLVYLRRTHNCSVQCATNLPGLRRNVCYNAQALQRQL